MKKVICMILAWCLVLSMAACSKNETPQTTDPVETIVVDQPNNVTVDPSAEFHLPVTVVSNVVTEDSLIADDSPCTFILTYNDVIVASDDLGVDMTIRQDLETDLSETRATAEEVKNDMHTIVSDGGTLQSPGSVTRVIIPSRVDDRIISFSGYLSVLNSGAAHPNTILKSATYDATTGSRLTLWDVVSDSAKVDELKDEVLKRLEKRETEMGVTFNPDYQDAVMPHFDPEDDNSGSWYLTDEGIVLYFSTYELAPYAVGSIEIAVSYDEMPGLIQDSYLPGTPEKKADGEFVANGNIGGSPDYLAVQDWKGTAIDLGTKGFVRDVRVERVISSDGKTYDSLGTLFAADWLEDGKVVRILADLPDVMYSLRLSYTGADGRVVRYITQSGKDGSILLVEN